MSEKSTNTFSPSSSSVDLRAPSKQDLSSDKSGELSDVTSELLNGEQKRYSPKEIKTEETEKNENMSDSNSSSNIELDPTNEDKPIVVEQIGGWKLAKGLMGAAVGNFLEWFDFAVFALLANEIGDAFFPPGNSSVHLLEVFSLFAGSFLMRPLGGMLFGYLGDKYGRLFALRMSIFMMAIPTFLTGILPTYNMIGIAATIMLIILRLTQGVSVGGEISGALVYVLEICPQNYRSFFGVLVQLSGTGTILASLVNAILRFIFSKKEMKQFGWRIPFILGLFVAFFGVWMRKALQNSNSFLHIKHTNKILKNPIKTVFSNNKVEIFLIVAHLSYSGSMYYILFAWIPNYLQNKNLRNHKHVISNPYIINVFSMLSFYPSSLLSGWLGDRFTPKKIMIIGGIINLVCIVILFPVLPHCNYVYATLVCSVLAFSFGLYYGPISVFAVDIFYSDASTRYSGLGIGYNMALAIFGGTAPLVATTSVKTIKMVGYSFVIVIYCSISLLFVYFSDKIVNLRDKYYKNKLVIKHKMLDVEMNENNNSMNDLNVYNNSNNSNDKQNMSNLEVELR